MTKENIPNFTFAIFLDKNLPQDLLGYWHLSDDLTLFGKYGSFKFATNPDPTKLFKYSFIPNSPVQSFTGKYGLQFDGTIDTSLLVFNLLFSKEFFFLFYL
jgi:hypothetical protein